MTTGDENDFWGKAAPKGSEKANKPVASEGITPDEGFWSKSASAKQKREKSEEPPKTDSGVWGKAAESKKAAVKAAAEKADPQFRTQKRKRLRKRILIGGGVTLLVVIIALVAFAPAIAGSFVPGIIEGKTRGVIAGSVRVESADLSWGGPQRLGLVRVLDEKNNEVARLKAESSAGLPGLIFGGLDLGTVTLTGVKAEIIRYADGTTNIEKVIAGPKDKKKTPAKKTETRLPEGLRARVAIVSMQATFTDMTTATPTKAGIRDADLAVNFGTGLPVALELSADVFAEVAGAGGEPIKQRGKLTIESRIDKWSRPDGTLLLDKSKIDATVSALGVPVAALDVVAGPVIEGSSLRASLGETLDLSVKLDGTLKDAVAQLTATLPNAGANADVRIAGGVLTSQSPIRLSANGKAIRGLVPMIDKSLKESGQAALETMPDLLVTVQELKVNLPETGAPIDLRGTAGSINVSLTETSGTVKLTATEAPRPFRIAPLDAKLETKDLAKGAHLTAASSATIGGQPAGRLTIDLGATTLLDDKGAPIKGPPAGINGTVSIREIATAIAQPFVQALDIDLPRDVGPTLDVEVAATSDTSGTTGVNLAVSSEKLTVDGGVRIGANAVTTSDKGIRINAVAAGAIASRFLDEKSGWRVGPAAGGADAGRAVVTISGVNVPRNPKGELLPGKATAQVEAVVSALEVASTQNPGAGPLNIRTFSVSGTLAPNGVAKSKVSSRIAHAGSEFELEGQFDLVGLLDATDETGALGLTAKPLLARPVGKLELRNVPVSLAALAPSAPAKPGETPLDLARLLADVVGPSASAVVTTRAIKDSPGAINVIVNMQAERLKADVGADLKGNEIVLNAAAAQTTMTPQSVTGLVQAFAPGISGVPKLSGPSRVEFEIEPVTIPLGEDGKPVADRAGVAVVALRLPGRTMVEGLIVENEDGTKRDLGKVGVEGVAIKVRAPLASVLGPGLPGERWAKATLTGSVLGSREEPLLALSGDVQVEISEGKPAGEATGTLAATQINTRSIERIMGKEGLLSGLLGTAAGVTLGVEMTIPPGTAPGDLSQARYEVEGKLSGQRVQMDDTVRLVIDPLKVSVARAATISFNTEAAWINSFLAPPAAPGAPPKPAGVTIDEDVTFTLAIRKLALPRSQPGDDAIGAALETGIDLLASGLAMTTAQGQRVRLTEIALSLRADAPANSQRGVQPPIAFQLGVAEAAVDDQAPVRGMLLTGTMSELVDLRGGLTPGAALVNMNGELPIIPTALVDTLAKQDGVLIEALGPVMALTIRAERLPLMGKPRPGAPAAMIDARMSSVRATASLKGTIRDGVFVSEAPLSMTVTELTQELSKRFIKGLPILGTLEKQSKDAPAMMDATGITYSLDNDPSKLNADVRIDPGEARFGSSSAFAQFLRVISQKDAALIGRRLEPLHVSIKSGVATYDRWRVPLGEFTLETEGTVDMVKKQMDVVTYIPFGALSDQAAGKLNTGLGSLLGRLAPTIIEKLILVPFRTKGSLDNPSTSMDLQLMAKNVARTLSPEDLFKHGVEGARGAAPQAPTPPSQPQAPSPPPVPR